MRGRRPGQTLVATLVTLCVLGVASRAGADGPVDRGLEFLESSSDPRGSWGESRQVTSIRDTSTVLRTLRVFHRTATAAYQGGLMWLSLERRQHNDDSARAIGALEGSELDFTVEGERQSLIEARTRRRGWGLSAYDTASSPLDTALSINTLLPYLDYDDHIDALSSLTLAQNPDGGWTAGAFYTGDSLVSVSSEAIIALQRSKDMHDTYVLEPFVDKGVAFLLSRQNADGSIGDGPLDTALAVQALVISRRDVGTAIADAAAYLTALQLVDGSWGGDPFLTAHALLALRAMEPSLFVDLGTVQFTPNEAIEGDLVELAFAVRNGGARTTGAFVVRVYRGLPAAGLQIGADIPVASLDAGAAVALTVQVDTTGVIGGQSYTISIDPLHQVLEGNEDDNVKTFHLPVRPRLKADLVVTLNDIVFTPARAREYEDVDITVGVRNLGDEPAHGVQVRLYDGDPTAGGYLVHTEIIPTVFSGIETYFTYSSVSFPRGIYPMYVTVDEANVIAESDEENNDAFRQLVVVEDVDLVITNADLVLGTNNPIEVGTSVTLTAVVYNHGAEAAAGVVLRMQLTGEDVMVGDIAAGGFAQAVFSIDTHGRSGIVPLEVVADPLDQISEYNERNNKGTTFLQVAPHVDISTHSPNPFPARQGSPHAISIVVQNQGDVTATNIHLAVFDAPPAQGGRRISPDRIVDSVGPGFADGPGAQSTSIPFSTTTVTPGTRTLYVVSDPDDLILEADETNNVTPFTLLIHPMPDLGIIAAQVAITPPAPSEYDAMAFTATVRNFAPVGDLQSGAAYKIRVYDGDPATGTLLVELSQAFVYNAVIPVSGALPSTIGRVGPQQLTFVVDPDRIIPDSNHANNILVVPYTIAPATNADLAVTRDQIAHSPTRFAPGDSVDVHVTIKNLRPVAAVNVPVTLYLGNPDAGGLEVGTLPASVPALGATELTFPWNTGGLPSGDVGLYVAIDPDETVEESARDNNLAARGVEVGLPVSRRPTGLTAQVTEADVAASWTAPSPTAPGYYLLRDEGTSHLAQVAVPRVLALASGIGNGNNPASLAINGSSANHWIAPPDAQQHWLEVRLDRKYHVSAFKVETWSFGRAVDFDLQGWDGVQWVNLVEVRGNNLATSGRITLDRPFKTSKVRFQNRKTGVPVGIAELWVYAPLPATTTSVTDLAVPAGSHAYAVTSVDAAGVESKPSAPAPAEVAPLPSPAPVTATAVGGDVQLSWASTTGRRSGVYLRRDGKHLETTSGEIDVTATAAMRIDGASRMSTPDLLFDGNVNTWIEKTHTSTGLIIVEATFPHPRPLSRALVRVGAPAYFAIQRWDGAGWVDVHHSQNPAAAVDISVPFPATMLVDRVRFVMPGTSLNGGFTPLYELRLFARAPLAPTATAFTDVATPPGSHAYEVVAIDTVGQTATAEGSVGMAALPQVQGLTASLVSGNVVLSWTAVTAPAVAGYRVIGDGVVLNPTNTTVNLARTATVTAVPPGNASRLNDGNSSAFYDGRTPAVVNNYIEVKLDAPRLLRSLRVNWADSGGQIYRVQTWDGTRWITQLDYTGVARSGVFDHVLPMPVTSDAIRMLWPTTKGGAIFEVELYAEGPVTSTTFTHVTPPHGTRSYTVAAMHTLGAVGPASEPATIVVGTLRPPTNLAATQNQNQVMLSWTASTPTPTGYHVYRNGTRLTSTPLNAVVYTDSLAVSGSWTYEVRSAGTGTTESLPSNTVTVLYEDIYPPSAPVNLRWGVQPISILWNASPPSERVVGYDVYRITGPGFVEKVGSRQTVPSFAPVENSLNGYTSLTYRVIAVDEAGLESAPSEIASPINPPPAPTIVSAFTDETTVTFNATGTGFGQLILYRDGLPVTMGNRICVGTASTSTQPVTSLQNDFGVGDQGAWTSAVDDPTPTVTYAPFGVEPMIGFSRIDLRWLSPLESPRAFYIEGQNQAGAWETIAAHSGLPPMDQRFEFPHRFARRIRLVVTEKADPMMPIGLYKMQVQYPAGKSQPLGDTLVPGGQHSYTMIGIGQAALHSLPSAPRLVQIAQSDLTLTAADIEFSQDKVAVGDHIQAHAYVYNRGDGHFTGPANVEMFRGDPGQGGVLLGSTTIGGLDPGEAAHVVLPIHVTAGPLPIVFVVDRTDAFPERNDFNDKASRGLPFTYPYRSYTYGNNTMIPFAYEDNTEIIIRHALSGETLYAGILNRGEHPVLPLGIYTHSTFLATGTKKFALWTGALSTGGWHTLDAESRGASREFFTVMGYYSGGYNHAIVFATEDDTHVTITNQATNQLLYEGDLDRGEHALVSDPPGLTETTGKLFLHIRASKPVTNLNFSDYGFSAADVRGLYAGTEFFTAYQPKSSHLGDAWYQMNFIAYQDDTFIRVVNQTTGKEILATVLDKNELYTLPQYTSGHLQNQLNFFHITASNDVTVEMRPYSWSIGAGHESVTSSGSTGTGIATRHLAIGEPVGRGAGDFNVVFAYFDDTVVTVTEVQRSVGQPVGKVAEVTLDDGEFLNLHRDPLAAGGGGDLPGRLYEIKASKPVTARLGGGDACADFVPVLFGNVHLADLEIKSTDVTLSDASGLPGEVIDVTIKVKNVGVNAAEQFPVDIYDGDPARGGRRLHRELVARLYGADELEIVIPYEIESGFHELHILADSEGAIEELDEDNNRARVLITTEADVRPEITALVPEEALAGQTYTAHVEVQNRGGQHLERVDVQLYDGDPTAGGVEVASTSVSLMAGEVRPVALEWSTAGVTPGPRTLYVVLDGGELIPEAIEDNNTDSVDTDIIVPDWDDLQVVSLELDPATAVAGTPMTARVVVENRGREILGPVVDLSIGGVIVGGTEWPYPLGTGQRETVEVTFVAPAAGSHLAVATVDPEGLVDERDEANNSAAVTFTTTDPGLTLVAVATPQTVGAGAAVAIAVTLTNQAAARTGALSVRVLDDRDLVVAEVVTGQALAVGSAEEAAVSFGWNSGTTPPGAYTVEATYSQGEQLVATARGPLAIVAELPVTVVVYADRASYGPHETAFLQADLMPDVDGNAPMFDVPVDIGVFGPGGLLVFGETQLVDLYPGSEAHLLSAWDIGTASPGAYEARATVLGTTAVDGFLVADAGVASVSASVSVSPNPAAFGQPLAVTGTAQNAGATGLTGAILTVRLVDTVDGSVVGMDQVTAAIAAGSSTMHTFSFDVDGLALDRDYLAVFDVSHGGRSLASAFEAWVLRDDQAPDIVITGVADGACVRPPVQPVITIDDPAGYEASILLDAAAYDGGPITADGHHVLDVVAEDTFGNQSAASVAFRIDGTQPSAAIAGVAEGAIVSEVVATASVSDANLVSQAFLLDGAPYAGQAIVVEGPHTLSLTAVDCAGNTAEASVSFVIDRGPPVVTIGGVEDGALVGQAVTPSVVVQDATATQLSLTLDGAPLAQGVAITAEGPHLLVAIATDAAGNQGRAEVTFTIDSTPPSVAISGVADGGEYAAAVTPVLEVSDAHLVSQSATLDGAAFVSGTSVSAEGAHTLVVTATDGAGNVAHQTVSFGIDTSAPAIAIGGVTDGSYYDEAVTPTVVITDFRLVASTQTLDGAAFVSGTTVSGEGPHVLEVTAEDGVGHRSTATVHFIIDTTDPLVAIDGVPEGECVRGPVSPTYAVTDANLDGVVATLDGAAFTEGGTITGDGEHRLEVVATDRAGNSGTDSATVRLDATPPVVTVLGVSDGAYYASAVSPEITVDDANLVTHAITLDGAAYTAGPITAEGAHTLHVEGTDCAGNVTSRDLTFTVDTTAPVVAVNGVADGAYYTSPVTIEVTSFDAHGAELVIHLNGAAFASGTTVDADGEYILVASATDPAGNETSRTVRFTLDRSPPVVLLGGFAAGSCGEAAVTPTFSATDANLASVEARLDGAPFVSGASVDVEGSHVLSVTATDAAGLTTTRTAGFIIDRTAPLLAIIGVDEGAYYPGAVTPDVEITEANIAASSTGSWTPGTSIAVEGTHTLAAEVTDCAGHSAFAEVTFTIDATPPTLTVTGLAAGEIRAGAVTPEVTAGDAGDQVSATLNGHPYTPGTPITEDGEYVLDVTVTDLAGNQTHQRIEFSIDTRAPATQIVGAVDGGCSDGAAAPQVEVTDAHLRETRITLDGAPYVSGTPITAEGQHVLAIFADDHAGNSTSLSVTFIVDATAPAVDIAGVTEGAVLTSGQPVVTVDEANLVTTTILLDGQPFASGALVAEGAHELVAEAVDCAGHTTRRDVRFTVDATDPAITVTGVSNGLVSAHAVTPVVSITDANLVSSAVTLDGVPFPSGTSVSAEGDYVLVATATDAAGRTRTVEVRFAVDATAPVISLEGVEDGSCAGVTPAPTFTVSDAHLTSQLAELDGAPFLSGTPVSDGAHVLVISATDGAGHRTEVSRSFRVDTAPPTVIIAGIEDGAHLAAPVTPSVDISDANLVSSEATLDGQPYAGGTISTEGAHTLLARAEDCAGHETTRQVSFTLDLSGPTIEITGVEEGGFYGTAVTPVVTITDANLASSELTLDGAPFTSGTAVSTDGHHVLVASATDGAGQTATRTVSFDLDTTAPTVTVTGVVDGTAYATAVAPTVQVTDANLQVSEVTLDGAPFVSGTSVDSEGAHELLARAVDRAGTETSVLVRFSVDLTDPSVVITGVTDGASYREPVTPVVEIADANLGESSVTLDGAPFESGTTVATEGGHLLEASAVDTAGRRTTRTVRFTIDTTAPVVTVEGAAEAACLGAAATLTFGAEDGALASFTAVLDGAPVQSPVTVAVEGPHTLTLTAVDAAGNETRLVRAFVLDTTAPVVDILDVADGEHYRTAVTPAVTLSDANLVSSGATLDGAPYVSHTDITSEGAHHLVATARDCAGNEATAEVSFTLDLTAPTIEVGGVVDGQVSSTALTPSVTVTDTHLAGSTVTLDGLDFLSGTAVTGEGAHVLTATATDHAGNVTTVVLGFTLDYGAPVVLVDGVLDGQCSAGPVTPTITVTDDNLASSVSLLDDQPFTSGTSVHAEGAHELAVQAVDRANLETEVSVRFVLDNTAPTVEVSGVTAGLVSQVPVSPTAVFDDVNLVTTTLLLDGQPLVAGTVVSADGSYLFEASATDCAGHTTTVAVPFEVRTSDIDVVVGPPTGEGRVLLALENGSDVPALRQLLVDDGVYYQMAVGRTAWLAALRTGRYDIVVLYRPNPSESGTAFEELRENVAAGVGLIVIKDHPDAMPKLGGALGAVFGGKLKGTTSVQLSATLGGGLVPASGDMVKLTASGGTLAGTSNKGPSVAAVGGIGLGRSVLLAWDTELVTGPALRALYRKALAHVAPPVAAPLPNGIAPVAVDIGGTPGDYLVTLAVPAGLTIEGAAPVMDTADTWEVTVPASGASQRVTAFLRLPDADGSYTVVATVRRLDGTDGVLAEVSHEIVVGLDLVDMTVDVIGDLEALSLSGSHDTRRDQAVTLLEDTTSMAPGQATTAIGKLVSAADKVAGLSVSEPTRNALRGAIGRLLRVWQSRL